jgi:hypothetical protein
LLVLLLLTLAWPAQAGADRVDRLVRILKTSDSYKVRLQVVITLGKLKDRRAVPALIGALGDSNYTVRGVAATALGQIGDKRAVSHLKRLARSDRNSFVKSQAKKALKLLRSGGLGPPAGTRFFITVGKLRNKARKGGKQLAEAFRNALLKEFSRVPGVWSSSTGNVKMLRKHRLKGFVLDGAILKLGKRSSSGGVEISCSIKVSLSTYPGNSMKAFYSGGASMEVDRVRPEYENTLYREIVEGAAQGAREHIARSYLSTQ